LSLIRDHAQAKDQSVEDVAIMTRQGGLGAGRVGVSGVGLGRCVGVELDDHGSSGGARVQSRQAVDDHVPTEGLKVTMPSARFSPDVVAISRFAGPRPPSVTVPVAASPSQFKRYSSCWLRPSARMTGTNAAQAWAGVRMRLSMRGMYRCGRGTTRRTSTSWVLAASSSNGLSTSWSWNFCTLKSQGRHRLSIHLTCFSPYFILNTQICLCLKCEVKM